MSGWFLTYGFADVTNELLIGAYPLDEDDVRMLGRLNIQRVLNLAEDREYRPGEREVVQAALLEAGIVEERRQLTDYGQLPPDELEAAVQAVIGWIDRGMRTYLHCRAGWQRSAAVAAGVIALRERLDIDEALEYVRRRKPSAEPLPHQQEDLRRWWAQRSPSTPDDARHEPPPADPAHPADRADEP